LWGHFISVGEASSAFRGKLAQFSSQRFDSPAARPRTELLNASRVVHAVLPSHCNSISAGSGQSAPRVGLTAFSNAPISELFHAWGGEDAYRRKPRVDSVRN